MSNLKGSKTHANLKAAFAGESQANRRYLYFAKIADVEGYPEVAGNFRDTAEGETGHAHGHLDFLKKAGDPATDLPIGDTMLNLRGRRDARVHRHVPGHGEDRARRGLRRDRRLVRDAGQGREGPRRQVRRDAEVDLLIENAAFA
jgi:rubrerythrin